MNIDSDLKRCSKCGKLLPLSDFNKLRKAKDGHQYYCRICSAKYVQNGKREGRWKEYRKSEKYRKTTQNARMNWCRDNPEKRRAQILLSHAICRNKIKRACACQICGKKCVTQAHHYDYNKPLDVVWLCATCHQNYHRGITAKAKMVRKSLDAFLLSKYSMKHNKKDDSRGA